MGTANGRPYSFVIARPVRTLAVAIRIPVPAQLAACCLVGAGNGGPGSGRPYGGGQD